MRSSELFIASAPCAGSRSSMALAPMGASNEWGPFRNATDMSLAVGFLFSAFVLGLVFTSAFTFLLRRRRSSPSAGDPEKPVREGGFLCEGPLTVYTAGATELAGQGADCAICLTEFADGDALRVLPACRHGFHAECVEAWAASYTAASKFSMRAAPRCPVCRASFQHRWDSPESVP